MRGRRVGPIHGANVRALREELRKDESQRRNAIGKVKKNLPDFVEDTFELTDEQRAYMQEMLPEGVWEPVAQVLALALENGGDIDFNMRHHRPKRQIRVELFLTPGSVEVT